MTEKLTSREQRLYAEIVSNGFANTKDTYPPALALIDAELVDYQYDFEDRSIRLTPLGRSKVIITDMIDLKPCPFCGDDVTVEISENGKAGAFVCGAGSACIGTGLLIGFVPENRASAIAAWNTRATLGEGIKKQ